MVVMEKKRMVKIVDHMNGDRACNADARANVKLSLIIGVAR